MWLADWTQEESEVPGGTTHLWEESWDDDDEGEEFSKQLKYILGPCTNRMRLLTYNTLGKS